jgi:cell division protein FtsQ
MHRADLNRAGYSGRRRFSRPGSGVAKVERQFSRAAATLAEEEGFDDVFRPHAVSRPRPLSSFQEADPARLSDEDDEEIPVLRTRRRVPVKRGRFPHGRLGRILVIGGVVGAFCLIIAICVAVHSFFMTDARFRIETASSIQVLGNSQVTRPELLSVFGSDIGRNIFHVPLAQRRAELEQLPWVDHATVMRLLPNQLRVAVTERVPVAFVRFGNGAGNQIGLVDKRGVLLDMPPTMMAAKRYSFPVVTGVTAQQSAEERASRMRLYADFMSTLSSTNGMAASQLSEVDLSDPEDVRVLLPSAGTDLLVHFGSDDFAARWQRLEEKLPGWRRQYPRLAGVDLRYQRQTVLEMARAADASSDNQGIDPATASAGSAHAPVKPAPKTVARPITHNHSTIQRGKVAATHKPVKKPNPTRNPARKAAAHKAPTHQSPTHRDTNP